MIACRNFTTTSASPTALSADSDLHLLGVLAHQVGRNDLAVELIGKALKANDRVPEFHYNIGLAYGALGRFRSASSRRAGAPGRPPRSRGRADRQGPQGQ